MATGGSYNPSTFKQSSPFETWAQVQGIGLYWDTENQFAAGKQGVSRAGFSTPGATYGQLRRAQAPGVDFLGGSGQRQLNFGGRDYGSQAIDRGEIGRIGSVMEPIARNILDWRTAQQANQTYPTAGPGAQQPQAQQPTPARPLQQWRQKQQMKRAGIPNPPQPQATQPGNLPAPVPPTPHPLATSNWREEQDQRRAEYGLGEPGQPTPDPSAGSRTYQAEVARRRAERTPQPEPTPATGSQRLSQAWKLQAEREAAVEARGGRGPMPGSAVANNRSPDLLPPEMRPGAVGTAKIPSPTSAVGGQAERLAAEGTTPRTRKKS